MAGVIANRVASEGHAKMVAASLRDIPLFATLPKQAKSLPERHLGLVLPGEVQDIDQLLDQLADQLAFDQAAWDSLPRCRLNRRRRRQRTAAGRDDHRRRARPGLHVPLPGQSGNAARNGRDAEILLAAGR
jgi:cobyrinic acid a,c-diamide synthase